MCNGRTGTQGHTRPRPNPYTDPHLKPNPKLNSTGHVTLTANVTKKGSKARAINIRDH